MRPVLFPQCFWVWCERGWTAEVNLSLPVSSSYQRNWIFSHWNSISMPNGSGCSCYTGGDFDILTATQPRTFGRNHRSVNMMSTGKWHFALFGWEMPWNLHRRSLCGQKVSKSRPQLEQFSSFLQSFQNSLERVDPMQWSQLLGGGKQVQERRKRSWNKR